MRSDRLVSCATSNVRAAPARSAAPPDWRPGDHAHFVAIASRLLREWQDGSHDALNRLAPLVSDELHALASRHLAREWRHDRLQTTVVVNEAYVRLFGQREIDWQNRGHFFAIAARLMRRILVDHARRQLRQKRGGGELPLELDDALAAPRAPVDAVDALDLDRALQKLQQIDPRRVNSRTRLRT
jgi:RNA polymerase sigma-70 factor, ECF subfamily